MCVALPEACCAMQVAMMRCERRNTTSMDVKAPRGSGMSLMLAGLHIKRGKLLPRPEKRGGNTRLEVRRKPLRLHLLRGTCTAKKSKEKMERINAHGKAKNTAEILTLPTLEALATTEAAARRPAAQSGWIWTQTCH